MKCVTIAIAGAMALSSPALAQAPAAPTQVLQLPPYTTNPAELPKVFAVGIRVADLARSVKFYKEGLGAKATSQITPREIAITFASGAMINVVLAQPDSPKGDGAVGFIFQTADIDALFARVPAAGGTVVRPASDGKTSGGIRVGFVRDPDGARIEVIQFPK